MQILYVHSHSDNNNLFIYLLLYLDNLGLSNNRLLILLIVRYLKSPLYLGRLYNISSFLQQISDYILVSLCGFPLVLLMAQVAQIGQWP